MNVKKLFQRRNSRTGHRHSTRVIAYAGIAIILAGGGLAFAWSAGWSGDRLTASALVDALEHGKPYAGFRRAHSKGVCVSGIFHGSGNAVELSYARVFSQGDVQVSGRLSTGVFDPRTADTKARVLSMALRLEADDGQEWRLAMNSFPFFSVSSVQAFYDLTLAQQPVRTTGKPNPDALSAFARQHPEILRFQHWAQTAPWNNSWANTRFNGIHSFRVINRDGETHFVRWWMRPRQPLVELTPAQRVSADEDYFSEDLAGRLAQGPIEWDLILTVAQAGDPIDDPSQMWATGRREVVAGTLSITRSEPQATGPCRDMNYDPTIVPAGIRPSDDPILAARSAAYSESFNRREREIALGHEAKFGGFSK